MPSSLDHHRNLVAHGVREIHDHRVEAVVDDRLSLGLRVPAVDCLAQALALGLQREVDDRGRPSARGPDRADPPVVSRDVLVAPGRVEVGVNVDRAREDVLARGVDPLGVLDAELPSDLDDLSAVDEDVRLVGAGGRDDGAACDERLHEAPCRGRISSGPETALASTYEDSSAYISGRRSRKKPHSLRRSPIIAVSISA